MNKILLIFVITCSAVQVSWATDQNQNEKKYSEKEFQEKLHSELVIKVDQIKRKSIAELTKEILAKEKEIELLQLQLKNEKEQREIANKDLEEKIKKFQLEQQRVLGCIQDNDEAKAARIRKMVETVSNMKPDKAAQLLSVQDSDIAVNIISRVDPKKASKIFNLMSEEVSARLQKQYLNMKQ